MRERMILVATEPIAAGREIRIDYDAGQSTYWACPPEETNWRDKWMVPPPPSGAERSFSGQKLQVAPPVRAPDGSGGVPLPWDGPTGGDVRLARMVPKLLRGNVSNWLLIASHLPGRTARECRSRYLGEPLPPPSQPTASPEEQPSRRSGAEPFIRSGSINAPASSTAEVGGGGTGGVQRVEDCGACINCLDKPKFGGPHTRRKPCVMKRPTGGPSIKKQKCSQRQVAQPVSPPQQRGGDGQAEDEFISDAKLWPGAHAEGWRVHAKGGAHYTYVSPGGDRYGNKADAFQAAGREQVPMVRAGVVLTLRVLPGGRVEAPLQTGRDTSRLATVPQPSSCGCEGCLVVDDCGECGYCLDKPKFGGRGILRQRCFRRRCVHRREGSRALLPPRSRPSATAKIRVALEVTQGGLVEARLRTDSGGIRLCGALGCTLPDRHSGPHAFPVLHESRKKAAVPEWPEPLASSTATLLKLEDCGQCVACADKPKFGGLGVKKRACIARYLPVSVPVPAPVPAPDTRTDARTAHRRSATHPDRSSFCNCEGCRADECGECVYCLDQKKHGGSGIIRQRCIRRRCVQRKIRSRALQSHPREVEVVETVEVEVETVEMATDEPVSGGAGNPALLEANDLEAPIHLGIAHVVENGGSSSHEVLAPSMVKTAQTPPAQPVDPPTSPLGLPPPAPAAPPVAHQWLDAHAAVASGLFHN